MNVSILGVKISNLRKNEILERIQSLFSLGKQVFLVTPNPEMLVLASKDAEFRELLNSADVALADGFGLSVAAWMRGEKIIERITGTDFIIDLALLAIRNNIVMYLLGGKNGVGEQTKKVLSEKFNGLLVQADEENFIDNPNQKYIVLVALGHGRQEAKAQELLKQYPNVQLAMGVGGAFDFLSGRVKRAPQFLRMFGLEWLWRLLMEPWRVKRIWNATAVFLFLVFKEKYQKSNF